MKELQDCIQTRRSVRIYREEPVDRALIRKLIWNGCRAPSGSNIQSWQFIVADDPELVAELVRFSPGIGKVPPCIIILCADRCRALEKGGVMGRDQLSLIDISMAAENIILSAVDHGLGTCAVRSFPAMILQKILKLPEHIMPELLITLGYPDRIEKMPPKRPLNELLYFNGWGEKYAGAVE